MTTWKDAPTQLVNAGGAEFAYRQLASIRTTCSGLDGRHDRPGDRAAGAAARAQADPRRHRARGRRWHREGDPHLLPRHRPRSAHPPRPQGVPLLHADSEGARGREGVPGTARGTHERPRQAISISSFRAQLTAIHRWGLQQPADLASIHQPVLVINGESDKMVPTKNSVDLDHGSPAASSCSIPTPGTAGVPVSRGLRQARARVPYEGVRRRAVRQGRTPRRRRARAGGRRPRRPGQGQRCRHQPAGQDGPQRRVQAAPEIQEAVRARPRRRRRGDRVGRPSATSRSATRSTRAPATCGSGPSPSTSRSTRPTSRSSRPRSPCTRRPRCRWWRWPPGRRSSTAPRSSPARRSSSTPAPAAWARPSSSSPSTSAPRRHDRPRRERRAGARPRRRQRRRLHHEGLHRGPLRLRRRAGLARRREPREVADGPQAGRTGDRRDRTAGRRVRQAARSAKPIGS